jgi:predicted RNase H-like nuclease (RuvC/YqgF family)
MMLNLKKGVKKLFFLDRVEKVEKTEKILKGDIKRYDQDIEELRIEVEAINKEVEKIKKTSKKYRGIFILLILGNLLMGLYILLKIEI